MRFWLVGLLGLLLTVSAACGGDDDDVSGDDEAPLPTAVSDASSGGATLQDACTLLTEDEVNAALGDDEVASTNNEPPTESTALCQWQGSSTGNRYLYLSLLTVQSGMTIFENNYASTEGAVSIPGIGDEAVALPGADTPNDYRFMTAAAVTSSLYIQVDIAGPNRSDEEAIEVLTNVLQQVLAKLI